MKIQEADLQDISIGAAFLGTGGGGDPYIGRLLALSAIKEFGAPEMIGVDDVADDAMVFTIAMLGVPAVLGEKAACGDDIDLAIDKLKERLDCEVDALVSIEIGGVNSMIPIVAGARTGLPVVDADGMGRAFPEIQMVTFNIYGVPCSPLCITDDHLESLIVEAEDPKAAEDEVRVASVKMGCSVMLSSYPMTGKQLKESAVRGTLTLAKEIGQAIRQGRRTGDPIEALLRCLQQTPYYNQCRLLFDGKVVDINREIKEGFSIGFCKLVSLLDPAKSFEIMFQNEHLVAKEQGVTKALVPDLICVVDRETAQPIPVEALKYGQRVAVVATSAAPIMRTEKALAVFGPHAFGIDEPFVPIEELVPAKEQ